ncbi:hypothetical protein AUK40_00320 [Candidatus Wirthbacteria bacterium CG2_30_54_11]|uniref:Aspartyl/glutamyl-tRNA(Asn/Gln) amidotransferase subunit C n=1 Tax=Candidatus Wirthbacteria bacterium CG2_30_54_11 TaxID=1817892 RepID=A0A1J5J3K8_9BACT|nr:MAG: hypothetical protein AUK40_00320 [Candidatus Wirthbacteria bacterium CG2_30_54_11]
MATQLTKEQVEKIAELARLKLTSDELDMYRIQLSEIMSFFDTLSEVNTANIPPTAQTTGLVNRYFADVARPSLPQDRATREARVKQGNYFKVKAVL